jgi:hypothetical protein
MFEPKSRPLAQPRVFYHRLARSLVTGLVLLALSLGVGMLGYHSLEPMGWDDAFINASMILSGMGPIDTMHGMSGKLFSGFYALYSGIALISIAGVILAPVFHRFLHRFHLEK